MEEIVLVAMSMFMVSIVVAVVLFFLSQPVVVDEKLQQPSAAAAVQQQQQPSAAAVQQQQPSAAVVQQQPSSAASSVVVRAKGWYKNPVLMNLPDPCIVLDGDSYWAFGTNPGFGFAVFSSPDLKSWTQKGTALDGGGRNGSGNFWAPECFKRKGAWYLTYTADTKMYIAKSKSGAARGPYEYHAGPLLNEWGIDSHYFEDPVSKKEYMFFAKANSIHVGELRNDMKTLVDVKLCFGHATHPESWVTSTVNEAPWCLYKDGMYYVVYSGNSTGPTYAVGFATAPKPTGPYTKSKSNPIFSAPGTGPGHVCFFTTRGGTLMMGYHRHIGGGGRNLCIDVVEKFGNGALEIDGPRAEERPLPV